jgi:diaminohydroxyphosphoribosylaminopyrimidine deaminase/5-amino-6-(5-phosphoribosylamino)uracil reductase
MKFSDQDKKFMARTLALAAKGSVSPNPMVGAVITRNSRIVAEGWHRKFGGNHAEIEAINPPTPRMAGLRRASKKSKKTKLVGNTLYVNLEPCVGFRGKKTPGCVDAIIKSGIARVVVAIKDPNPLVSGRGCAALRNAGIKVGVGCLAEQATKLNEKFIKWMSTKKPFVAMKVAMSLDGKIATKTGDSKWITSRASRKYVHKLRDSYDAILVGKNTVLKDNPTLAGRLREPMRIILDSSFESPLNSKVFRDNNALVVTTNRAPKSKINLALKNGIKVKVFKNKITINPLLRYLGSISVSSLFVEGGSQIFGSFIDEKCVDKAYFFIAPKIIGGKDSLIAISGKGVSSLKKAMTFKSKTIALVGEDILVEGNL